MNYWIVFVGAGLGGALRHGANALALRWFGSGYPVSTLAVNIIGSFAMGLLAGYFAFRGDAPQAWRLFLATGVLGGFTTFSAFSLDVMLLYERGAVLQAALYIGLSVVLSV
ncbi:MAG: fluoride efflux transporter CrcB, partial [Burkholderiales bacterium]